MRSPISAGLLKKSVAPDLRPSTADSMVPCPVSIMTSTRGNSFLIAFNVSIPSIPGILTSRITTCIIFLFNVSRASIPLIAVRTLYPFFTSSFLVVERNLSSSSTSMIFIAFIFYSPSFKFILTVYVSCPPRRKLYER